MTSTFNLLRDYIFLFFLLVLVNNVSWFLESVDNKICVRQEC
jgi:hypothetical protein